MQIDNLNRVYEILIKAANQQVKSTMVKIIDNWCEKKRSSTLLNAIKSFDKEAIAYLINRIEKDIVAVDLSARFGQPIVNTTLKKCGPLFLLKNIPIGKLHMNILKLNTLM